MNSWFGSQFCTSSFVEWGFRRVGGGRDDVDWAVVSSENNFLAMHTLSYTFNGNHTILPYIIQ